MKIGFLFLNSFHIEHAAINHLHIKMCSKRMLIFQQMFKIVEVEKGFENPAY